MVGPVQRLLCSQHGFDAWGGGSSPDPRATCYSDSNSTHAVLCCAVLCCAPLQAEADAVTPKTCRYQSGSLWAPSAPADGPPQNDGSWQLGRQQCREMQASRQALKLAEHRGR